MRLIGLIIVLFTVTVFTGCDLKSAADYYTESVTANEKADYPFAIALLGKAIKKDPHLKKAYLLKGLCYERLQLEDSAINTYKTLLGFDGNNATALFYTGLCLYRQKKFEAAIENYNKALFAKGVTAGADSIPALADSNISRGAAPSTIPVTEVSLAQVLYERGMAYYSLQQISRAYTDFQYCIAKKYNLDECLYMSGLCWQAADKNDKACEAFKLSSAYGNNIAKNHLEHLCK